MSGITQDMTNFHNWINEYIPKKCRRRLCRIGGIDKNSIRKWERYDNFPSTLSIVYLSLAISKEFCLDYEPVVLKGIYAISKDRGVDIVFESDKIETIDKERTVTTKIKDFSKFYLSYMNEEMMKDIVRSGVLSYQVSQSYKRDYLNIVPKPNNLVELCKYISSKKGIETDKLVLEALEVILA